MRRRTFLSLLPAIGVSSPLLAGQASPTPSSPAPAAGPSEPPLPGRWEPGAARFIRPDVRAGDRPFGASFASRSAAYGLSGAAATAHPLATQAGIDILKRGGSAVDAAVAINACLGFLEPTSSGIGGDCYAMLWDPKANQVVGLAGSGASPRALTLDIARSRARKSNVRGMGSGLVADGPDGGTLGFMFQDRGQLFSLRDGHPNIYAPGKRPFQTIIPGFATRGNQPWMSFGVMGGDMQPQGQAQILIDRIDYGLEVQSAGDSPRWHHEGSSQSMGEDAAGLPATGLLRLETGVPDATRAALAGIGWTIGRPDGGFSRYEAIERRTEGGDRVYAAASEMRADGCALAY